VTHYVMAQGFTALPITLAHAERAGSLLFAHRDPFDRMLIAQSLLEDLLLVSNEELFDAVGARRYW
jgi:PIN domain nuclease of toxin-antitoxin system